MLDRSLILRNAHSRTRWVRARVAQLRCEQDPYSTTFAYCLREAWKDAKEMAREALSDAALSALEEVEALQPENIPARIGALHAYARTLIPNSDGFRKIMADADDLAQAARCLPFTATQDIFHVAH